MTNHSRNEKYTRLAAFGMGPYVMKKLKVCKRCGQMTGVWHIFCPGCRKILSGGTLFDAYKKMHTGCPHCRTVLAEDAVYCPHCGRKVGIGTNE